jgi:glutamine amidotransferase
MFAVTGKAPVDIREELESLVRNSFIHKHGWGYADFSGGKTFIKREVLPAYESTIAQKLLAAPFQVQNAFFHLRYATIGAVEPENVHPFAQLDIAGRTWAVIHNGTLFRADKIDPYFHKQAGSTDTERLLLYLVDRVNKLTKDRGRPLAEKERFDLVEKIITELAKDGNKLNIIFHDGEIFYLHANARTGSRVLGTAASKDALYEKEKGGARFFATFPLSAGDWRPVQQNTLFSYRNGALLRKGAPHPYEYFESDDDIQNLYRGFSAL